MRAHYLQHVPFEGLGTIEFWLKERGYEITETALYGSIEFPELSAIDFLIVMGGPMSVNDEEQYPWLAQEKPYIRKAVQSGIPVLGICLGAQLIANAMGAKVYENEFKEIGWFPVEGIPADESDSFAFPSSVEVFHWHGETFDLPPGAHLIARSSACGNQAYQLGKSVIGLQFHLETTPQSAKEIVTHCRDELIPGKYIQSEQEILSAADEHYRVINQLMGDVLGYLCGPSCSSNDKYNNPAQ
jgi:GMP synthase-like glutamine amidotransferase